MLCYDTLCYAVLYYAMLCYAMLCYVMLMYVIVCYCMLCYVMLCYVNVIVMLSYDMLCYAMPYSDMLCYVVLCYVLLRYVMLCYPMLCYAMLCYVMSYLDILQVENPGDACAHAVVSLVDFAHQAACYAGDACACGPERNCHHDQVHGCDVLAEHFDVFRMLLAVPGVLQDRVLVH